MGKQERDAFIVSLGLDELTEEQFARFQHHLDVSETVFKASVAGMLKGVRKYGPEPEHAPWASNMLAQSEVSDNLNHWLPHAFSDAVDTVNYLALMADALGVDLNNA